MSCCSRTSRFTKDHSAACRSRAISWRSCFHWSGHTTIFTLKHSLKKTQLEPAVRAYTEKQLKAWNEKKHSFRAKLFKPLQPTFERWAKSLQKRAALKRDRRVNEFHSGLLSSTVGLQLQDFQDEQDSIL